MRRAMAPAAAASAAMVGWWKTSGAASARPCLSLMRPTTRIAVSESPPAAKKLSFTPRVSPPSTSWKMAWIERSSSVPASTKAAPSRSRSVSCRLLRWTLPVAPFGMDSTNAMTDGTLKAARRPNRKVRNAASSARAPARSTTAAARSSPSEGWGRPKAVAWATSGCSSRASSTSRGEIFSPPRLTISFSRPEMKTYPSLSIRP